MTENTLPSEPTASSLKRELGESLELLKKDFESLKNFVAEIAPEGVPASIPLSKDDVHDLLPQPGKFTTPQTTLRLRQARSKRNWTDLVNDPVA